MFESLQRAGKWDRRSIAIHSESINQFFSNMSLCKASQNSRKYDEQEIAIAYMRDIIQKIWILFVQRIFMMHFSKPPYRGNLKSGGMSTEQCSSTFFRFWAHSSDWALARARSHMRRNLPQSLSEPSSTIWKLLGLAKHRLSPSDPFVPQLFLSRIWPCVEIGEIWLPSSWLVVQIEISWKSFTIAVLEQWFPLVERFRK